MQKVDWNLPSSKGIDSLLPEVAAAAQRALDNCAKAGFKVIITQTYRSPKDQEVLYLKGRQGKVGEKIVTNARAWQSYHQFRLAIDIVPSLRGQLIWNPRTNEEWSIWNGVAAFFKNEGFSWSKEWKTFKELAHFQWGKEISLADLRKEYGVKIGQIHA